MLMTAMFYPPINYWFSKFVELVLDKKNAAIGVLALAHVARSVLAQRSKL